jgi:hypothetical protein
MDGFLLDCCFISGYEGLKFRESTPPYAKSSIAQSRDSAHATLRRVATLGYAT